MSTTTVFTHADSFNFSIYHDKREVERVRLEIQNENGCFQYWLTSMHGNNQEVIEYLKQVKELFDRKEPNLSFHISPDKDRDHDLWLELFGAVYLPIFHTFGGRLA